MELDNLEIVLYGAGVENVKRVYWASASTGLNIIKIIDRDEKKQHTSILGTEVTGPEWLADLDKKGSPYAIVITARNPETVAEIQQELASLKAVAIYSSDEFMANVKSHRKIKRITCLQMNLADHCNLSCARCITFSPLVKEPAYLKEELFERDMKRLFELTNGDIADIRMLGGEPLLHPQINHFPPIVRKYFPDAEAEIVTNGIKLLEMPESFFDVCRKFNIHIEISQYPINVDYNRCLQMLKEKGITAYLGNPGDAQRQQSKVMEKLPLKLDGTMDAQASFDNCWTCKAFTLRDGRLHLCPYSANIDTFNRYFHKNLPATKENGVDLFSVRNLQELVEKLSRPTPLCAYCDPSASFDSIPWTASKRDISEWTI